MRRSLQELTVPRAPILVSRTLSALFVLSSGGCAEPPSGDVDAGLAPRLSAECAPLPPVGACGSDAECERGVCRRTDAPGRDLEDAELACAEGVGAIAGSECATEADCLHALCSLSGRCIAPCRDTTDCDYGERCGAIYVRGREVVETVAGCVPDLVYPADVTLTRTRHEVAGVRGSTVPIEGLGNNGFAIVRPDCALGFVEATAFRTVEAPSRLLFDARTEGPHANPLVAKAWPLTLLVPSSTPSIAASAFEVELRAGAPGGIDVFSLSRDRSGGRLDVDVYYLGGRGLSPEGDRGPVAVQVLLDGIDAFFGPAGIFVGDVRQHEVPGLLRERLSVIDRGELDQELALVGAVTAGERTASLSLVLVRSIDGFLAHAGAIPVPVGYGGAAAKPVVIGLDVIPNESLGRVVAHELGHALGLFHTTEMDGTTLEAIEDTAHCSLDADANGDGVLTAVECMGFDGQNLMFWTGVGLDLTPGQQSVVARSHTLH